MDGARAEALQRRIDGLLQLTGVLADERPIDVRLSEVCRLVTVLLDCDRSSIFVLRDGRFHGLVNHGNPPDVETLFRASSFSVNHPLFGAVFQDDQYVLVDDAQSSALLRDVVVDQARILSMAVAPLNGGQDQDDAMLPMGFITAEFNERPGVFTAEQGRYLLGMARSAGMALAQDALHQRAVDSAARMRERAVTMTALTEIISRGRVAKDADPLMRETAALLVETTRVSHAAFVAADVHEDADGPGRDVHTFPLHGPHGFTLQVRVPGLSATEQELLRVVAVQVGAATDAIAADRAVVRMARFDDLTDLPNRRHMLDVLQESLDAGEAPSLIVLDLDGFKVINDSLGHEAGDQTLIIVARRLQEAAGDAFVARFGGDEFHIVRRTAPTAADDVALAHHILGALSSVPLPAELGGAPISGSLGLARARHFSTASALVRDADTAMYLAKAAGGGQVRVFDREARRGAVRRHRLQGDLHRAINEGTLDLHYQPIHRLEDDRIGGVEALLRWPQGDGAVLMPLEFLDVADTLSLMGPLTEWVLRRATADAAALRRVDPSITVSVNIPPITLTPSLLTLMTDLVAQHDIPECALVVELTEHALGDDLHALADTLRDLTARGFGLSLDDFGAGHSSLARLSAIPLHELKIDRDLILSSLADPNGDAMIAAIVRLGQWKSARVVAEGATDLAQVERLRELGCTHAQCYVLGRPVPIAELVPLLSLDPSATGARQDTTRP